MNLNRETFRRLLRESDFRTLFNELGWDRPGGNAQLAPVAVDGVEYDFRAVAQRGGFQALVAEVDEVPSASICRKIDTRLKSQAHHYIAVLAAKGGSHHLWAVTVDAMGKRDVVTVEYANESQTDFLYSKLDGITFEIGSGESLITEVVTRVSKAFIVNSEKVTKEFYEGFRKQHRAFAGFIRGIDDIADRDWYTSVMLNRMMFCYFVQKKGFFNGETDYLRARFDRFSDRFYSFYRAFLRRLFSDGLNAPTHSREFEDAFGRIPYLNGGMFDEHELERRYPDIDIDDAAFDELFTFFDRWQWHLDTRITASGRDINPDVLGYIFEQYINDRAQMGAYYTKEDITEYIGRNTIVPFLLEKTAAKSPAAFKPDGEVWRRLRESGSAYIYPAVLRGWSRDWRERLPSAIADGLDTAAPDLLTRRAHWNEKTAEAFALPTEIWRETIARLERADTLLRKIADSEIANINDFITHNLNLRAFVADLLRETNDHLLVAHFYDALCTVTILDPTCGSGAFLFAALNILEPLYEICIERMRAFNAQNSALFRNELAAIGQRDNTRYFVYKSIILNNLYGVDLMEEATEIAKLRLFLKMISVVDADLSAPNLGLDPLPDIDFNIRAGNTLVGYAKAGEINFSAPVQGSLGIAPEYRQNDLFADQQYARQIDEEMQKVAHAYELFKDVQLRQADEQKAYKEAKRELRGRLATLNETLNHHLHADTAAGLPYDEWLDSHHPFNWVAEFYQIIVGNGGFDVIIGNPPYVSMREIDYLKNTAQFSCSDLYGHVIKRVFDLLHINGRHGFIVMHNLAFSSDFKDVRAILKRRSGDKWFSFYGRIPSGLFAGDVRVRNAIYITSPHGDAVMTSRLHRWFTEQRETLFTTLYYCSCVMKDVVPMLEASVLQSVFENKKGIDLRLLVDDSGKYPVYFKKTAYNYLSISPVRPPFLDEKGRKVDDPNLGILTFKKYQKYILLLMVGQIYFSKWLTYGDEFNLAEREQLDLIYDKFVKRLPQTVQTKLNAGKTVGSFNTRKLKEITDKSDAIFLKYLTDEPLKAQEALSLHVASSVVTDRKNDEDAE